MGGGHRVQWDQGYVFDAPRAPFDAVSCLPTLHFVADDGERNGRSLRSGNGLKPGAPFVLVDCCIDRQSPVLGETLPAELAKEPLAITAIVE